jgi:dolichol-phosphate mannosyltransferase
MDHPLIGPDGQSLRTTPDGTPRVLVAIPVYNEEKYVARVLAHVLEYADDVLVIDDGSTDRTVAMLPRLNVDVIRHKRNAGYGRSMRDAFRWAAAQGYDWVITIDCDEQHEPQAIPAFVQALRENRADVISGSRYLNREDALGSPPADRRAINAEITGEVNRRLGLELTDAFCGFKAYRVDALARLSLSEDGYAFPMQFWVQAAARGLRIRELPVKLIYNDPNRSFGGPLDDACVRLAHYRRVLHAELTRCAYLLPPEALEDVPGCCSDCARLT